MMRILRALYTLLHRRGLRYFWYLIWGVFLPKAIYHAVYRVESEVLWRTIRIVGGMIAALALLCLNKMMGWQFALAFALAGSLFVLLVCKLVQRYGIYRIQQKARNLIRLGQAGRDDGAFTHWTNLRMPPETCQAIEAIRRVQPQNELVIGEIDQDGLVLGIYGPFDGMDIVRRDDFQPRLRYKLDIVLRGEYVLLRKDFRQDHANFVREWYHLAVLAGKANVPAIYEVDETTRRLYMNFIPGRTMRDVLAEAGAQIRDAQTGNDPELAKLSPASRAAEVIERGRKLALSCFSASLLLELEQQLDRIHACKIASLDLKYGNVVIHPEDGKPWVVDFENARAYSGRTHPLFLYKRDRDRAKFNHFYHRSLLTESSARAQLEELGRKMPWYAPLDFGNGLTVGPFWSTDSGTGRWEYLNERILAPLIMGKRILDLGSNNGTMPMMMLRSGAGEVVGLELSPVEVERANLVKRIFEWRDMRSYRFEIHNLDMLEMLRADWGCFDIVTAFCSLYYLEREQMAQVVRRAADISSMMVLQANVSEHRNPDKRLKASLPFLKNLLQENGFPVIQIYAPDNFSRPLLIGRRARN